MKKLLVLTIPLLLSSCYTSTKYTFRHYEKKVCDYIKERNSGAEHLNIEQKYFDWESPYYYFKYEVTTDSMLLWYVGKINDAEFNVKVNYISIY